MDNFQEHPGYSEEPPKDTEWCVPIFRWNELVEEKMQLQARLAILEKTDATVTVHLMEKNEQLRAENKALKEARDIAKIKLEAIKIRAADRRPIGGKGDKPIWVIAKTALEEIAQALKDKQGCKYL